MKLKLALEEKLMDVRLRDRLVAEGKVKSEEVTTYLKDLGDEEGNYTKVEDSEATTEQ